MSRLGATPMRIRPALAITPLALAPALALTLGLALGPSAPAIAAQLAAQEIEFTDPLEVYSTYFGLATRSISRAGAIHAIVPDGFDYDPSFPLGVTGFYVDFPEWDFQGYYAPNYYICGSSSECFRDMAINQAGRVVGQASIVIPVGGPPPYNWAKPLQYRYSAADLSFPEFEYLTTPPGYPAAPTNGARVIATAVNDGDLIAGTGLTGNPAVGWAPIWWPSPSALAQELPRLPGVNAGPLPARINLAGVIVGNTAGSAPERAAVWKPDVGGYSLALLGELPGGTSSRAYDIGRFGRIVGRSNAGSATQVAVVWKPSGSGYTVTPLPVPPGGSCSAATAINERSDIAGTCTSSGGDERGVIWRNVLGTYELLHELEPLPGHTRSIAFALDDTGQAGGGSGPLNAERAVLWPPPAPAAPVSVPALSPAALLTLAAAMAAATAATLRAR